MASKEDDKSKEGKKEEGGDGKDGDGKDEKKGLDKLTSGLAAGLNVVKPQEKRPKLVKGNYMVHVHIIEARDLIGAGMGDMSDPVARIEVMGKKQHTKIVKKALNVLWDEVLVFEFKDLEPEEIERGKCVIRILDANTFRSDVLIGLFEFDLSQVYFSPHHELYRQWCALTDTTDKREGIQGYLKFSLTVLGPNDEQFIHSAADADDDDGGMLGVMMPPEVEQHGKILRIQALYVADLPLMDEKVLGFGGGCDPYVRVEFAGVDIKTKHFKGQTAEMLQELLVPVMEPTMSTGIKLSVMDWDQAGSDDRIAVLTFDYADIKDHPEKYQRHRWYQLYGSPEPNSNAEMLALVQLKGHSAKEKMDKGFIPGSYYRGRIMLNFMVEDSKEPKKDVITCNGLLESQRPEEIQWKIEFDLYEGSEIPEKGSKIAIKSTGKAQIEVVCGRPAATTSTISEKKEVVEGQCQWYSPLKDIVVQMPKDPEQCPDIFVYLVISGKRVSFIRFPFAAMVARGWEVPPAWHILVEDPVLDALTEQEFPGAILFSMRVGPFASAPPEPGPKSRPLKYDIPASELGGGEYGVEDPLGSPLSSPTPSGDEKDGKGEPDLLRSPTFSKKYEEGKVSKVGTLTLELVEATNLPALDRGGTSDPFVKFEMGSYKFQSAVKNKTLNPKWNQTFTFKDVSVETPLRFEVFDHDTLSNDKMGDCNVDIRSMQLASKTQMGTDFTHDAWFFLSNTKATNAQVRLKFGFKYVSLAESATLQAEIEKKQAKKEKSFLGLKIPGLKKKQTGLGPGAEALGIPERRAYQLRCHIFQARSLPALDSNGLADPYVVIRVAGKKIKLDRKEKTLNPQWYITKDINITLPIPLHFAPKIQCFVYDWDQVGRDEPLGRFALTCLEASTMNPSLEEINPKWFPLTDFEGKAMDESKVLASFQLVTADDAARAGTKITDIRPPTTPMFIEIVTLGLRSLQSTLGVHKTFINFELPNGKRFATRQSNRPTAKSPNFLQVLKLPCDLPTKAIFAPTLLIEVRDVLFGGLIKRLIGTSALDMSQFMIKSDEKGEGAGDWKPAERVTLISDEDVERQIKDDEMKKREAELKAKLDEEKRKMDEDEKKEKDEKVRIDEEEEKGGTEKKVKKKDDLKEPLLQDPSSSSSSGDVKVEVKDDGTGVGDIKDKGAGDPLLGGDEPMDAKAVKKEFDKADKVFDTLDLASAGSIPDEPEEIPKYMKGRVTVDDELEDTMTMKPFHKITVATGQKNAGKFSMNKWRKVGTFKGLVRLFDEKNPGTEFDTKELLNPVEMYCRLYILRGLGLTPKDSNGKSDPYLIIKLGKTKISTRDRYIKDTLAPDFYESFEIPCTIPGDAELEITCMDWDGIGDDLIGSTKVDIEDRWFTKEWRAMPLKPLERRTLRTASSTQGQGKLEMWVELLKPEQAKREPMLNIKPPAPDPFELRLIIWGVRDVPIKDELTKQNDLYVTCSCSVPGLKKQETDTHWRSKKGKGNFNWRMKFPLSLPIVPWPRLRFQIWDRDIFSPNDSIAELVISVKALCKMAQKKKNRVKAILKGKDRFYLEGLRHPNFKGSQGKMEISLEVLPLAMASQLPAGPGRSDPNANCFLPEPEGRVNWSLLHPFDMLKEILGPELYRKICLGCCCMLFTAACVFMAPMIVSNLITNIIT